VKGMGLLPIETTMSHKKYLAQTRIEMKFPGMEEGAMVSGYEIHCGKSRVVGELGHHTPLSPRDPVIGMTTQEAGVIGTYLHGIFENDHLRRSFLNFLRKRKGLSPVRSLNSYKAYKERNLDLLADWLERGIDTDWLRSILGLE